MATELQYQKYLTDAACELGGYGFKLSNRFIAGIPDLFIQLPGRPTLVVEVKKWTSLPKSMDGVIESGLTPLQRQTLIDLLKAGTKAGWLAIYREGTTDLIYSSPYPRNHPTKELFLRTAIRRKRGTPWTEILIPAIDPLYLNTPSSSSPSWAISSSIEGPVTLTSATTQGSAKT